MQASLEVLGGIIRVHPEGAFGAPYSWSCHAQFDGPRVVLRSVQRAPTTSEARAVKVLLMEHGITDVTWERKNTARPGGRHRTIKGLDR